MRAPILICCALVCIAGSLNAQTILIAGKGGTSSYGSLYLGNFGGGGGDISWNAGPIVGLGVRIRTSEGFAIDGVLDYSHYTHKNAPYDQIGNDPTNTLIDFTLSGHSFFRITGPAYFGIIWGVGMYHQHEDGVLYAYGDSRWTGPEKDEFGTVAILGTGIDVRLSHVVELSLEATLRIRMYVTPALQLGAAFAP